MIPGLFELGLLRNERGRGEIAGIASHTLRQLLSGPLFDRRDGGVHRMAAAPGWEMIQYEKPLLCDGDGPIAMFRRWCTQFYSDGQEAAE